MTSIVTGQQCYIGAGSCRATVTGLGAGLRELMFGAQPVIDGAGADELPPGGAGQVLAQPVRHRRRPADPRAGETITHTWGIQVFPTGSPLRTDERGVLRADIHRWETMTKLLYKQVNLIASALGGLLAGLIFKRVWKIIGRGDDALNPTDEQQSWGEILLAATLHGAIFAVVKAALDRGAAETVRKLTGLSPAAESQQSGGPT